MSDSNRAMRYEAVVFDEARQVHQSWQRLRILEALPSFERRAKGFPAESCQSSPGLGRGSTQQVQ